MTLLAIEDPSFFIELLEKGGLPALTIGVLMTIFIFIWKSHAKSEVQRDTARQAALLATARERVEARERDSQRYLELMKAYEEIVGVVFEISKESTAAVTRLAERVAYCPYREPMKIAPAIEKVHGDSSNG